LNRVKVKTKSGGRKRSSHFWIQKARKEKKKERPSESGVCAPGGGGGANQ